MSAATKKPNLVITRLIDAPREKVFNAWIDEKQFAAWWGPHTFTAPRVKLDVRPGGKIDVHMQGPKGSPWEKPYSMGGEFREVSRFDRLVFTATLPDGKGGVALENLNEVTFADKDGKTELVLTVTVLKSTREVAGALAGMEQGWSQSLEKLDELTRGKTFEASREIPASIEQVFAVFSPERLPRWWGPAGFTNTSRVCEFKIGGRWSLVMHGPDGRNYPNEIVFAEIEPGKKVVVQHISEPKYRLTISLIASPAGTVVTWSQAFESVQIASRIEHIVVPANEQNLERMAVEALG